MEDIDAGASNVPASISLSKERITSPTDVILESLLRGVKPAIFHQNRTRIDKVIGIQKNMREKAAESKSV